MLFDCVAICHYDKTKDVREVDQFGFVDLHAAFINNSIPSDLGAQEGRFNNIENPLQVRARPSDVFEAENAQKALAKIVKNERTKMQSQS